jgi:hypothetical protein
MNEPLTPIILAVVALLIGAAISWVLVTARARSVGRRDDLRLARLHRTSDRTVIGSGESLQRARVRA